MSTKRLKVLCLHGYKQYDIQFKNRTNALRKSLKNIVEFHYVTAPHRIPFTEHIKHQDANLYRPNGNNISNLQDLEYLPSARAWYRSNDDGTIYDGIEETLEYVSNIIKNNGPFDGILGFSQGGVLTMILCLMRKYPKYFEKKFNLSSNTTTLPDFKFAWIVSSFLPRCNEIKPLINEIINSNDVDKLINDISLLLVVGHTDEYIPTDISLNIIKCFVENKVKVVQHDGGHFIPSNKEYKDQYIQFLSKM